MNERWNILSLLDYVCLHSLLYFLTWLWELKVQCLFIVLYVSNVNNGITFLIFQNMQCNNIYILGLTHAYCSNQVYRELLIFGAIQLKRPLHTSLSCLQGYTISMLWVTRDYKIIQVCKYYLCQWQYTCLQRQIVLSYLKYLDWLILFKDVY